MARIFILTAILPIFLISCEKESEDFYPLWTPTIFAECGNSSITLHWYPPMLLSSMRPSEPTSDPEAFEIYLSEGSQDNFKKITTIHNLDVYNYTLSGLTPGKYYFAKVTAIKHFHFPVKSNTVMIIPGDSAVLELLAPEINIPMEYGTLGSDYRTLAYLNSNFSWDDGEFSQMAIFTYDMITHDNSIVDTAAYSPDWSPAGNKLIFCTDKHEITSMGHRPQQVAIYDLQGREITRLTQGSYFNSSPEFSPDGNWIVYSSDEGHHDSFEIWKMAADGSQKSQISDNINLPGLNWGNLGIGRPVWSADGNYIYFNKFGDDQIQSGIFKIPVAGGTIEPVIKSEWSDYNPAVSPDNEKIAFISNRTGTIQIWLYEMATGKYSQVTRDMQLNISTYWGKIEWIGNEKLLFSGYSSHLSSGYGIFTVEVE